MLRRRTSSFSPTSATFSNTSTNTCSTVATTTTTVGSLNQHHHHSTTDHNTEFIWWIANRLTSYDEEMHKEILEDFFTIDAKYVHPALTVEGKYNIRKVFRVWTSLNKDEPEVTNIVFDGHTAVISLIQNLRPRVFPLLHLQVPATTTLLFKDTEDGLMIYSHQDSWTLEGLVQSMPLLGWWYDHVVRNVLGRVLSSTGGFLHTAYQTTGYLAIQAEEVQKISSDIIEKSSAEIQQRSKEMTLRAQTMVDQTKDKVEKRINTAREEVERMRLLMRPPLKTIAPPATPILLTGPPPQVVTKSVEVNVQEGQESVISTETTLAAETLEVEVTAT